jgi:hypothetical protein
VGTWGPGIFQEDAACDVRDGFRELVGAGISPEEATARLRERFLYGDETDPVLHAGFWLGLAVAQWETGRLLDGVRAQTLAVIDRGADLPLWEGGNQQARARALQGAKAKLLSPQRASTRIPRPRLGVSPFQVGDLVAYTAESGRVTATFWVIKNWTIERFIGPNTTAMLLFLSLGRADPAPVESLVRGIPSRRRDFYQQFCVLSLHDGENAVPPRWQVIANSPIQPERFEAIGQNISGFTPMFAKFPRGARLRTSWVETWMETWASRDYSPMLDDQAIVREIDEVLAIDAADLGPQVRRQDREHVSNLKAYLDSVSARLRKRGRLNSSDLQRWEAVRLHRPGASLADPIAEGVPTSIAQLPPGNAWETLRAFDADFIDFVRWDAASA